MTQGLTSKAVKRQFGVGRFTVELLEHFELHPSSEMELYFGLGPDHRSVKVDCTRLEPGSNAAQRQASQRAKQLKTQHHFRSPSNSMLAEFRELPGGLFAVWGYSGARTTETVNVEVYRAFDDGVARFVATAFQSQQPEQIQNMLVDMAARAQRLGPESAEQRGVCLDWLLVDGDWDGEIVNANLRSTRWRDVVVDVFTNSVVQEFDGGLLKRWGTGSSALRAAGFSLRAIRQGPVKLAGRQAEELLTDGREAGKLRRDFDAETLPKPSSKASPYLKIGLRMGGQVDADYVDPSLSEADSIDFWNAVIASVQARRGAI